MYCLFDANVIAAYYLPRSSRSKNLNSNAQIIIDSVRTKGSDHFLYIPNFCIAEVFSTFMKYTFGDWNRHVRECTIDKRVYGSLCKQFQMDIHNAKLFYHYELNRYHILAVHLVAPVDHYYTLTRGNKNTTPAGTYDQLIVTMGLHLTRIHKRNNVTIITGDDRLHKIIKKCRRPLSPKTRKKLNLDSARKVTGISFSQDSFPMVINLKSAKKSELIEIFGDWPLAINKYKKKEKPYRWTK